MSIKKRRLNMSNPWILMNSGLRVDLLDPDVASIDILDIAHGLSNICRFTGQTSVFYSVAEHCMHVSSIVEARTGDPYLTLGGLLHDAHEAYTGDISSPMKAALIRMGSTSALKNIVELLDRRILSLCPAGVRLHSKEILDADIAALKEELRVFFLHADQSGSSAFKEFRNYLLGISEYKVPRLSFLNGGNINTHRTAVKFLERFKMLVNKCFAGQQ